MNIRTKILVPLLALALLLLALALGVILCLYQKTSWPIEQYAKKHDAFTLSEIFGFSWDVAYHDMVTYDDGEAIKAKYGVEFSVKPLPEPHIKRLLFFHEGVLVKEIRYDIQYLYLSPNIEEIYPNNRLRAVWNGERTHLQLLLA